MQTKLKHKTTVIDNSQSQVPQVVRMQRRNKTMLRTNRGKDGSSNEQYGDEKQMKTFVDVKIEQLHQRMKAFFNHQRKSHLEKIGEEMQVLRQLIGELRQQLNRPKSIEEIQKEKHELLRRKNGILEDIQKVNKELKQNKRRFIEIKLEGQQIDREISNAKATLEKYQGIVESSARKDNDSQQYTEISGRVEKNQCMNDAQQNKNKDHSNNHNFQRILNDSLCEENITQDVQKKTQSSNNQDGSSQKNCQDKGNDHIHITEVTNLSHREDAESKDKLPLIKHSQGANHLHSGESKDLMRVKFVGVESHKQGLRKKAYLRQSHKLNDQPVSGMQSSRNGNNSTTSFASLLPVSKPKRPAPLDVSFEWRKYQKLVSKRKWAEIDRLFGELDEGVVGQMREDSQKGNSKKGASTSQLEELLMGELRKVQYKSYKEKGYHQGLRDKTYQIKVELKSVFRNFSPNEFFQSVMEKKPVQNELLKILQSTISVV